MNSTSPRRASTARRAGLISLSAGTLALTLTACAGGVETGSDGDAGAGVEPRADFATYEEALSDMAPVTLTYQPSAQSAETMDGYRALELKENVEEASGGKITLDIVYGQAIAGYSEIPDALVDGRIDIAYTLPIYDPSRFPVYSAFVTGTTLTGSSPRAEELAANAAMLDVAWNSEEMLDELESNDLTPLVPFNGDGTVFTMCTDSGATAADWQGRQVRISSAAQERQLPAMGSSPVSLEYVETYEALQRGAVDCTLSAALAASTVGLMDIASHFSYTEQASFARGAGRIVAGPGLDQLPLAGQQLIFDQMTVVFKNSRRSNINGNVEAAQIAREQGGGFEQMDEEVARGLVEASEGLVADEIDSGAVPEGFETEITEALEKWRGVAEELELGDEGDFSNVDEWHDDDAVDLMPFAERVYEDVMVAHRPS